MRTVAPILWILAATAAMPAQGIALLEGPSTANLDLVVLDENNPTAPGQTVLQGIELLPIEITGRTVQMELASERPRRIQRHGLWRIELPGGGRLFHYRRQGGAFWGYLHVPADGRAQMVLERAGIGAGGVSSPFTDRLGVSPDGSHAAVALVLGGLAHLRLDGGTFASTGTASRVVPTPVPADEASVMVGRSHVFFLTQDERLWRMPLQDGAQPLEVSPPPVPTGFFKEQLAMAGDGSAVVCLYGPRDQQTLWLVRETGPVVQLPPPPSKYEDPDYLPEGTGHPALLLNGDGTRLMYVDGQVRDEVFLLDVAAAVPPLQITADPIFQPYIGSHILPKFVGNSLYVAIGDPNRMDWFRADVQGAVMNLTVTGSALQPFPSGTLDPTQALRAGTGLLAFDVTGSGLTLRRIDLQTGNSVVQHTGLTRSPLVGNALSGPGDLLLRSPSGDRLLEGITGNEIAATPPGMMLTEPNRGPQYSATWLHLASGWGLAVFFLPDGSAVAGPLELGVTQVVMTRQNGCVVVGQPLRYLAPAVYQVLNRPAATVRVCVSGAGG